MKKFGMSLLVATLLFGSDINYPPEIGQNSIQFEIKSGWNLLGSSMPLNIPQIFNNQNIKAVWSFDRVTKRWKFYSPDPKLKDFVKNKISIDELKQTGATDGFWVFATQNVQIEVKNENEAPRCDNITSVQDFVQCLDFTPLSKSKEELAGYSYKVYEDENRYTLFNLNNDGTLNLEHWSNDQEDFSDMGAWRIEENILILSKNGQDKTYIALQNEHEDGYEVVLYDRESKNFFHRFIKKVAPEITLDQFKQRLDFTPLPITKEEVVGIYPDDYGVAYLKSDNSWEFFDMEKNYSKSGTWEIVDNILVIHVPQEGKDAYGALKSKNNGFINVIAWYDNDGFRIEGEMHFNMSPTDTFDDATFESYLSSLNNLQSIDNIIGQKLKIYYSYNYNYNGGDYDIVTVKSDGSFIEQWYEDGKLMQETATWVKKGKYLVLSMDGKKIYVFEIMGSDGNPRLGYITVDQNGYLMYGGIDRFEIVQ